LVFVVGNSRSGTTMVARMLGLHSAIHTVREVHFFEELWVPEDRGRVLDRGAALKLAVTLVQRAREYYQYPSEAGRYDADAAAVVDAMVEPLTAENVFAATLGSLARAAGKTTACEQTPRNVYFIDEILGLYPDAAIVAVIRDPRDVLASQKNWWRMEEQGGKPIPRLIRMRHWANYHPVLTSLLWRGGARAQLAAGSRERVLQVRYEDVLATPEIQARRLAEGLGLEFEPAMLDVRRVGSSLRSDESSTGIDASHRGQWRSHLRPAEVWISQRLSAAEYAAFDYQPEPLRAPVAGVTWTMAQLPAKVVMVLALNLRRSRNVWASIRRRLVG
jgi:hypothetical protein